MRRLSSEWAGRRRGHPPIDYAAEQLVANPMQLIGQPLESDVPCESPLRTRRLAVSTESQSSSRSQLILKELQIAEPLSDVQARRRSLPLRRATRVAPSPIARRDGPQWLQSDVLSGFCSTTSSVSGWWEIQWSGLACGSARPPMAMRRPR